MPTALSLEATKRNLLGRKVKSLRHQGLLPANIFGKKTASIAVQLNLSDFQKVFASAGETNLVNLKVKNESSSRPILITNVQLHPVTHQPIHADFHQVDLKEKVTAEVPVDILGEAPAVKEKDAILFQVHTEIEVEALPTDLPDKFEVDVTKLTEIGQSILVKDLKVDASKVALKIDPEEPLVIIQEKKEEEEVTPPPAEEVPEGEAPAEEGEVKAPAEGEAKPPAEDKQKSAKEAPKESGGEDKKSS